MGNKKGDFQFIGKYHFASEKQLWRKSIFKKQQWAWAFPKIYRAKILFLFTCFSQLIA